MRIGVFVGSFNPVHNGHIKMAQDLIKKNYVDKILFIPTKPYWDKQNLVSLEHRINMLKLIATDKIEVDTVHNEYQYTYQILQDLSKNSNDEFYLIIGADNIEKFHLWQNFDDILKFKVIVLKRNNIDISKYINKFRQKNNFILADNIEDINISSTKIRENKVLREKYLDKKVQEYINRNNLYC